MSDFAFCSEKKVHCRKEYDMLLNIHINSFLIVID